MADDFTLVATQLGVRRVDFAYLELEQPTVYTLATWATVAKGRLTHERGSVIDIILDLGS